MNKRFAVAALLLFIVSCGPRPQSVGPAPSPVGDVPFFEGLGNQHRQVTTSSEKAQRYFNQGLAFLYAFNHDEAIRSFRKAAELDPTCAMAWWGVAVANGPHINYPFVPPDRAQAAWDALLKAQAHAASGTAEERALIEALAARYASPPPKDRSPLDEAYAASLRKVWQRFPEDGDIGSLFAEALMDLRPWDLYQTNGQPQPGTPEIIATLESVLKRHPNHPLALHLFIHVMELSPHPEKADFAADRLRELQPGLSHLVHMPSHIDVRRGRWEKAIAANAKAEEADRKYREKSPEQGFYHFYMAHNSHMRAYAAMMIGRRAEATKAMDGMVAAIPPDWARKNAGVIDGFMAMPIEARLRFGMWEEILKAPEPPPYFPIAGALFHYARGVAYASTGRVLEARVEWNAFQTARTKVAADATFGNNLGLDLLSVAEKLLEGEILYREGKKEEGLVALRKGVDLEDGLRYDEPPDWIHPVRHALGAALLEEGRYAEAEEVFREDLRRLPDNGWALFGLGRSLRLQGKVKKAAEAEARFKKVWATADGPLKTACYCQPGR